MPGNPLVRFDEGRVGRTARCRLLSYSTEKNALVGTGAALCWLGVNRSMTVAAEVARKREVCGGWQLGCGASARLGGLRGAPCAARGPLAEHEAAPHGTRSVPCLLHLLCG